MDRHRDQVCRCVRTRLQDRSARDHYRSRRRCFHRIRGRPQVCPARRQLSVDRTSLGVNCRGPISFHSLGPSGILRHLRRNLPDAASPFSHNQGELLSINVLPPRDLDRRGPAGIYAEAQGGARGSASRGRSPQGGPAMIARSLRSAVLIPILASASLAYPAEEKRHLVDHMKIQLEVQKSKKAPPAFSVRVGPFTSLVALDNRWKLDEIFLSPFVDELRDGIAYYLAQKGVKVVEGVADVQVAGRITRYEPFKG